MVRTALITGATSGIGKAVAELFAAEGFNLIITGRREPLLFEFSKKLEKEHNIKILPLCFDVRDKNQVDRYIGGLSPEWKNIDVLVNNAGLAVGLNSVDQGIIDDWERMIDTNIKGLLYVSRIVSNYMINCNKGHIINIGSIAGKSVYPNGNVYCATKFAVDALSKGMLMDLNKYNIKVSQICPGAVETEFSQVRFKGDTARAADVYKGFSPLTAEDIANIVLFVVKAPAHVNISDLVVMPTAQSSPTTIIKKQ